MSETGSLPEAPERVPVPIATVARESYSAARGQGHGSKDFSAMVDVLCDLVSIERPRLTT